MQKKRAKRRESGICLVLGQPSSSEQEKDLLFEHYVCSLGKAREASAQHEKNKMSYEIYNAGM